MKLDFNFYAEAEKGGLKGYYCGNRTIRAKDRQGNSPEIVMVTGNRSGGKTVYFTGKLIYDFIANGCLFVIFTRYTNQLGAVASGLLEAGRSVYFPDLRITERVRRGWSDLTISDGDEEAICGYAVSLNASDRIKLISSTFLNVTQCYFDEFLSENEDYLRDEVGKLLSVHKSIARGGGAQQKHLPVYMASNATSILNPYFSAMKISHKIQPETKFLRGDGFVYERTYQASAADALKKSGIYAAFSGDSYFDYAADNAWLNDNTSGICSASGWGRSVYQCTLCCDGKEYGLHYYPGPCVYYLSHSVDATSPRRFSVGLADVTIQNLRGSYAARSIRSIMARGNIRFQSLDCKRAVSSLMLL